MTKKDIEQIHASDITVKLLLVLCIAMQRRFFYVVIASICGYNIHRVMQVAPRFSNVGGGIHNINLHSNKKV